MAHTMGSLSVSTCRGLVHWQGLLLAVLLLNFWSGLTSAQHTVLRTNAAVGKDVLLRVCNVPLNSAGVTWYKGKTENKRHIIGILTANSRILLRGPPDGHVIINYDGSLMIRNVTLKDRGWYTAVVRLENLKKQKGFRRLNVYQPVNVPILEANNTTVTENKDAMVLTCHTNAASIQWLFNGTNLQPSKRIKMHQAQRILTINPVRREDAGNYQCNVSNPISFLESAPLELVVKHE